MCICLATYVLAHFLYYFGNDRTVDGTNGLWIFANPFTIFGLFLTAYWLIKKSASPLFVISGSLLLIGVENILLFDLAGSHDKGTHQPGIQFWNCPYRTLSQFYNCLRDVTVCHICKKDKSLQSDKSGDRRTGELRFQGDSFAYFRNWDAQPGRRFCFFNLIFINVSI